MKSRWRFFASALAVTIVLSTAASAQQQEMAIWPGKAPGSETWTHREVTYTFPGQPDKMVRNVVRPSLTLYAPDPARANGTAIIVAPGGGMRFLAWENEGTAVAQWLAARGVTAFVLKYRLLETPADPEQFNEAMKVFFATLVKATETDLSRLIEETDAVAALAIDDGRQAVRYLRAQATRWNIEPDRIGMIGFSAGARLTMGVVMSADRDSRLNFAAAVYGGQKMDRPAPADAPPLFLLVAQNDRLAYDTTQQLYRAWSAAQLPVELHSFAQGGHGFANRKQGLPVDHWTDLYGNWLDSLGLMRRADRP